MIYYFADVGSCERDKKATISQGLSPASAASHLLLLAAGFLLGLCFCLWHFYPCISGVSAAKAKPESQPAEIPTKKLKR